MCIRDGISNGHGAGEAALSNVVSAGDTGLVLATGRFAIGWGEMAEALGVEVELMDFGRAGTIDYERVGERLRADPGHKIKAVMAVHVDTSTSVRNDIPALRALPDAEGHPTLLMAGRIAPMGVERLRRARGGR